MYPHTHSNQETTTSDVVVFWVVRVVPPVVIIVLIALIVCLVYRCCRKRNAGTKARSAGSVHSLDRFPPSSGHYESVSLAPSISSTSSGSEGYGSLHSHSMLLGRHATSIHEIPSVEDIQYIDVADTGTAPGDLGQILVTLSHSQSTGLAITVHEAMNVPSRSFSESLDPYVRVRVIPNEAGSFRDFQFQSTVRRKTQNPIFEETFKANLPQPDLRRYSLQLVLVNYHKFSRKDVIGEVFVPLHDVTTGDEITNTYELVPSRKKSCGEILLSLSYLPTSNRLLLGVMRAKNLTCADETRNIDPCVRASLILGGRKYRRKKTRVLQSQSDPVFNEKFFFEVPVEKLDRVQVLVVVANERESGQDSDTDTGYGDIEVGQVILGYRSTSRAHAHWLKVMENPREIFAQWYDLTV